MYNKHCHLIHIPIYSKNIFTLLLNSMDLNLNFNKDEINYTK